MKRILPSVRKLAAFRIRRRPALFALAAAALLAWSACNLSDSPDTHRFIQLQLPDSLRIGDSVQVFLDRVGVFRNAPGDTMVLDTLWNGPLRPDTSLAKLPAPHYKGGDADLFVAAWHQGRLFYQVRVEYRKSEGKPTVRDMLPPDSLPPELKWQGPDSMDVEDPPAENTLDGMFPEMVCLDDRDRDTAKPSVKIIVDSSRAGLCWFEYHCRDRSGNASPPRYRRVRVLSQVDTVPPAIILNGPDTLVSWLGHPISLGTAICADAKDPAPRLRSTGSADLAVAGLDSLLYECTDASGNVARRTRFIRVEREPDSVKPVLILRGRDSVLVYDGDAYADEGADCNDDRDGKLPLLTQNPVDTRMRGDYVVSYACVDSAGNSAAATRRVSVARKPDLDKPVIALRGADTAFVYDQQPYRDSGATCLDARDGALAIKIEGGIDTDKRGTQTLTFTCVDSAGNAASATRRVSVVRKPDPDKPVIVLRGPDTALVYDHQSYRDSGAVCLDARDGMLAIKIEGGIDTDKRGVQTLTFTCVDSAGNSAAATRRVQVARKPDPEKPVIALRGPDSALVYDHEVYRDSGATCLDARDGALAIKIEGGIDTDKRGVQTLTFTCVDSAGNAASATRRVSVVRKPDPDKPVIVLRGPDTALVYDHQSYRDSGAVCLDARDGMLTVKIAGTIDTEQRGLQTLTLTCADSAGNAAAVKRMVRVARLPDAVNPVLTLKGPDSLQAWQGVAYVDSGAVCMDDRDGSLPIRISGSVNTAVRGSYSLTLQCSDSSGNAASLVRKVIVIRVPDNVKPALSLRGPDSLQVWQGAAYADSGADCLDDRDGKLPVQSAGAINTALRGLQTLSFQCVDSSGNQASALRKVLVIRVPDLVKPKITLRGNASVPVVLGRPYADAGADCLDDRDGALPVAVQGNVNTGAAAIYVLNYACSDSAGNAADAVTRSVTVASDTTPPVISLAGTDTMLVVSQAGFVDPGGTCRDSEDGVLPLTLQGITKPVTGPGWYEVGYACTDKSGNTAVKTRTLKLGLFGTYFSDIADGEIDTVNTWANLGGCAGSGFVEEPGGQYFGIVRFDLSKVNKAGLKSAKLHFFTFLYDQIYAAGFRKFTFQVYRLKSGWVEGTGDWFYHDGAYRNGGETWYKNYPLSDSMKAHVTNPSVASGVTGASRAMIRDSALVHVSSQSDSLYFGSYDPNQFPAPDHLTPIELDVSDYVKSADAATDFGFVVKVFGVPAGISYGFLNREAGGGPWAPRLMLEY